LRQPQHPKNESFDKWGFEVGVGDDTVMRRRDENGVSIRKIGGEGGGVAV